MKNVLFYFSHKLPEIKFENEYDKLVKFQIDNSLELGWERNDIILITNFDYEYSGIKAINCDFIFSKYNYTFYGKKKHLKGWTLPFLMEENIFNKDEINWLHDFDAIQINKFILENNILDGGKDYAMSDYGWKREINGGSLFFKENSKDFFYKIREHMIKHHTGEERAMSELIYGIKSKTKGPRGNDIFEWGNGLDENNEEKSFFKRFKLLDIAYNFGMHAIDNSYDIATKPIKVLHFHPESRGKGVFDKFVNGNNKLSLKLIDKRVLSLFNKHKIGLTHDRL